MEEMTVNHYLTGSDEPAEIYDPTLSFPSTEALHVSEWVELFFSPHRVKKKLDFQRKASTFLQVSFNFSPHSKHTMHL